MVLNLNTNEIIKNCKLQHSQEMQTFYIKLFQNMWGNNINLGCILWLLLRISVCEVVILHLVKDGTVINLRKIQTRQTTIRKQSVWVDTY